MSMVSQKNYALSPAGADLGLQSDTPAVGDETEEERRKRLLQVQKQQDGNPAMAKAGPLGLASMMLLGGGLGG